MDIYNNYKSIWEEVVKRVLFHRRSQYALNMSELLLEKKEEE